MELLTPALGLFFWTLVVFLVVFFILKKYAWKPILTALHDREESIDNALKSAENARKEMASLKSGIEQAKADAAIERDRILKEANEMKNTILAQAKKAAQEDGARIVQDARETINKEKALALAEIKSQVVDLALELAEKVLARKFENKVEQEKLVKEYIEHIHLN